MYSSVFADGLSPAVHLHKASAQYLKIDQDNDITNISGSFTAEAWVNFDALSGSFALPLVVFGNAGLNDNNGCTFEIFNYNSSGQERLYFYMRGTDNQWHFIVSDDPVVISTWYHLAVTWNGTTGKFYIDGVSQSASISGFTPKYNTSTKFQVGADWNEGSFYYWHFDGAIDEVRISDSVRYTTNFTPSVDAFSDDENTIALYHFDDDLTDSSSHEYDLTGVNSPTFVEGAVWLPVSCEEIDAQWACNEFPDDCEWNPAYPSHCQNKTPPECGKLSEPFFCQYCYTQETCEDEDLHEMCVWHTTPYAHCRSVGMTCAKGINLMFCETEQECNSVGGFWYLDNEVCYGTYSELLDAEHDENRTWLKQKLYEFQALFTHRFPFSYLEAFRTWVVSLVPAEGQSLNTSLDFSSVLGVEASNIEVIQMPDTSGNVTINTQTKTISQWLKFITTMYIMGEMALLFFAFVDWLFGINIDFSEKIGFH